MFNNVVYKHDATTKGMKCVAQLSMGYGMNFIVPKRSI